MRPGAPGDGCPAERLGRPEIVGDREAQHASHPIVGRPGCRKRIGERLARRVQPIHRIGRELGSAAAQLAHERDVLALDGIEQLRRRGWVAGVERLGKLLAGELQPAHPRGELGVARR